MDPITPISAVTATSSKDKTSSDLNNALWNVVGKSAMKLHNSQQQALYKLLLQYFDIFSTDKHDLRHTNALKHQIDTGNTQPIRQRVCCIPPARRKEAKNLLEDMLNKITSSGLLAVHGHLQ